MNGNGWKSRKLWVTFGAFLFAGVILVYGMIEKSVEAISIAAGLATVAAGFYNGANAYQAGAFSKNGVKAEDEP